MLIQLMADDGFKMKYSSATDGGEYHGPCAFCLRETGDGGDDRMVVHPEKSDCGKYFCRRDENHRGDGIDYLREFRGLGFRQACEILGVERQFNRNGQHERRGKTAWTPKPESMPPQAWREQARALVMKARTNLFGDTELGQSALRKLQETRFLSLKTIRDAHLGLLPEARWIPKERWDIEVGPGEKSNMWIPAGLLIPVMRDGEVIALTVRRRSDDCPRYVKITQSSNRCLWCGPSGKEARAAVVVESILDCWLLHETLPTDIAVIATGFASGRPDAETAAHMQEIPHVLVGLDGDGAGAEQALGWWERNIPNTSRLAYPKRYRAKDPGELAAVAGAGILRPWVEVGIEIAASRRAQSLGPRSGAVDAEKHEPSSAEQFTPVSGSLALELPAPVIAPKEVTLEAGLSHDMRVVLVRDPATLEDSLRHISGFDGVIGLDTETTPLPQFAREPKAALDPRKSRPRTLQFCTGDRVDIIDLNRVDIAALALVTERDWVGHNAVFDLKVLRAAGLNPSTPDCTQLQANVMHNGLASLQKLADEHLKLRLDKEARVGDWSGDLTHEQVEYAARDAWATLLLHRRLHEQVERRDLTRLYRLLRQSQPAVATMALAGIGLDLEAHERLVTEWKAEFAQAMADVRTLLGDNFRPESYREVSELLRATLDEDTLKRWPRTDKGNLSTDADSLAIRKDIPALAAIIRARSTGHALSQFGKSMAATAVDGRLYPELIIGAQSTGRFSCQNPSLFNVNRDPRLRSVFVPGPGRVLVSSDLAQIQLRACSLVSRDWRLMRAMEHGEDLHRLSTALIMGKRPEDVRPEERAKIKPVNFGLLFFMSADGLWRYARSKYGVDMSIEEAGRFRRAFFEAYPGIKEWHGYVRARVRHVGKVSTPCGRWSKFGGSGELSLPAAAAHVIQGAESEVMLASLGRLPDALRGLDAVPILAVHDEILLSVRPGDVEATERAVQAAMEQGMRDVFPNAPLLGLVDAHHGPNWHAAKHGG